MSKVQIGKNVGDGQLLKMGEFLIYDKGENKGMKYRVYFLILLMCHITLFSTPSLWDIGLMSQIENS